MEAGIFMMPNHPPERSLRQGYQWDLDHLTLCDQIGFNEAWIGEHFTSPWEPNPAPDLLIAQALLRTQRMKLAPGAHLLPYHHPAELAARVAYLDHMARGRFMFGIGSSGLPGDWRYFNVDGVSGQNREMTREALDIILKLWSAEEPFQFRGKYWSVNHWNDPMFGLLKPHIKPYQKPHPPIGIAGLTPQSDTLAIAGEHGFMPLSLNLSPGYLAEHWKSVERGAEKVGRVASRGNWRVVREVFVAETDAEARRHALDGMLGRVYREYLLKLFGAFGFLKLFKHDPNVADSDVTPEYLLDHGWLVGSPKTVTQKLGDMYQESGGFGTVLVVTFDHSEENAAWAASQQMFVQEVMPKFADLKAA